MNYVSLKVVRSGHSLPVLSRRQSDLRFTTAGFKQLWSFADVVMEKNDPEAEMGSDIA